MVVKGIEEIMLKLSKKCMCTDSMDSVASGACIVRRVRASSRGFRVGSLARARSLLGVLYIRTHSQRETWVGGPRPTGSLTARVLGDSGSAPPRVSTLPSSFVSRCLGPRVRSLTGASQQGPAP